MAHKLTTDVLINIRSSILHTVEGLSDEQLNQIPEGFNNNIIWNLGHLVATDQRILYIRSGLPPVAPLPLIEQHQKGARPDAFIAHSGILEIKHWLLQSIRELEKDYRKGLFQQYEAWTTPYGNTLANIEEAIAFLPFHEGLHFGTIKIFMKKVN